MLQGYTFLKVSNWPRICAVIFKQSWFSAVSLYHILTEVYKTILTTKFQ